ncbi:FLYWCH family member 2 isoform X3 [Pongo abelii]|uniref:FLYWCH family member 2 isoform X3 n=1 Tax=Pongo abelii TaxID=9601 RepID=UPI003004016C
MSREAPPLTATPNPGCTHPLTEFWPRLRPPIGRTPALRRTGKTRRSGPRQKTGHPRPCCACSRCDPGLRLEAKEPLVTVGSTTSPHRCRHPARAAPAPAQTQGRNCWTPGSLPGSRRNPPAGG